MLRADPCHARGGEQVEWRTWGCLAACRPRAPRGASAGQTSIERLGVIRHRDYERARLMRSGHEGLAAKIEHTSLVRGDHEGYDILSFEENGSERLIEVKTTKYGKETPFFVTRNEVSVSETNASQYYLYRMFSFREAPRLYTLPGSITTSCRLSAATYFALPR